jgi:hypothetical protein
MNNLECAFAVLESHRTASQSGGSGWEPKAVAADLVVQLGLDPTGEAKNAKAVPHPLEAEVVAAEAEAKAAYEKWQGLRKNLEADKPAPAPPPPPEHEPPEPVYLESPPPPAPPPPAPPPPANPPPPEHETLPEHDPAPPAPPVVP